jgi:hypothetical protein
VQPDAALLLHDHHRGGLHAAPIAAGRRNNLDEPSGVHWHGLEIESYPDGVPD